LHARAVYPEVRLMRLHRVSVLLMLVAVPSIVGLSRIHAAVDSNDPTGVRAALADGADINEIGEDGRTPVMHAAYSDKLRAAAALMKMGADATIRDGTGLTPMHAAAQHGYGKIVRMLLRYEVDANDMHSDGLTPFHRACLGSDAGHTDAVFAFLDGGVPPDQPTADNRQPLDMAGSENTRKLLMESLREKRRR
jgi:ankyrin repeat protein